MKPLLPVVVLLCTATPAGAQTTEHIEQARALLAKGEKLNDPYMLDRFNPYNLPGASKSQIVINLARVIAAQPVELTRLVKAPATAPTLSAQDAADLELGRAVRALVKP